MATAAASLADDDELLQRLAAAREWAATQYVDYVVVTEGDLPPEPVMANLLSLTRRLPGCR